MYFSLENPLPSLPSPSVGDVIEEETKNVDDQAKKRDSLKKEAEATKVEETPKKEEPPAQVGGEGGSGRESAAGGGKKKKGRQTLPEIQTPKKKETITPEKQVNFPYQFNTILINVFSKKIICTIDIDYGN